MKNTKKRPKTHWNYRIIATFPDGVALMFSLREVHYSNNKPNGLGKEIDLRSNNILELKFYLKCLKKALKKPILMGGEKFPKKFKIDMLDERYK